MRLSTLFLFEALLAAAVTGAFVVWADLQTVLVVPALFVAAIAGFLLAMALMARMFGD